MEVVAGWMSWVERPVNEHLPVMSEWTIKTEPIVLEGNGNRSTWNFNWQGQSSDLILHAKVVPSTHSRLSTHDSALWNTTWWWMLCVWVPGMVLPWAWGKLRALQCFLELDLCCKGQMMQGKVVTSKWLTLRVTVLDLNFTTAQQVSPLCIHFLLSLVKLGVNP